jgi:hypothetical protein
MSLSQPHSPFIPAKAGIQNPKTNASVVRFWGPAFAGASGVWVAVFLLLANVVHAQQPAQDTLKPGDTITGKLRQVEARHPNGTLLRAWQIVSDAPKPLAKPDEFCDGPPKTFHLLVSKNPALEKRLRKLRGKTVSIEAESFFCSETAWHIGDAVVPQWRLKP